MVSSGFGVAAESVAAESVDGTFEPVAFADVCRVGRVAVFVVMIFHSLMLRGWGGCPVCENGEIPQLQ